MDTGGEETESNLTRDLGTKREQQNTFLELKNLTGTKLNYWFMAHKVKRPTYTYYENRFKDVGRCYEAQQIKQ